jgi:hypothetical protein
VSPRACGAATIGRSSTHNLARVLSHREYAGLAIRRLGTTFLSSHTASFNGGRHLTTASTIAF